MYDPSVEGEKPKAGAPEINLSSCPRSAAPFQDGRALPLSLMDQTAAEEKLAILQVIQRELELWDRKFFGPEEAAAWVLEALIEGGFVR